MTEYEELDQALDTYVLKFGDGFPTYQYMRGRTTRETIDAINRCIAEGKDAYEMGLVTDDDDILY